MFLAVINRSTVLDTDTVWKIMQACQFQIRFHLAPLWNRDPAPVVFFSDPDSVPQRFDLLVLLDDAEQSGVLGYHRETPEGLPYARAFVKSALEHGGDLLTGDNSSSVLVSHEVCEWFVNPNLNLWAEAPDGLTPLEVVDPVQSLSYESIPGVAVCDFVTPNYFDQRAPAEAQLDYMNKLSRPFGVASGGYRLFQSKGMIELKEGDAVSTEPWLVDAKDFPAARTAKLRAALRTFA